MDKNVFVCCCGYYDRMVFYCVIENGYIEICWLFFEVKVDFEEEDIFGNMFLVCVVEMGYVDVMRLLLFYGCDVNCMSYSVVIVLYFVV